MQRIIGSIIGSVMMLAPVSVFASHVDGLGNPLPHLDGPNPALISMPWGLTGGQTPWVKGGVAIKDAAGIEFVCPAIFFMGCYDITGTDYYKSRARDLAKQLQSGGWNVGQYSYWLTH